MFKNLIKKIIPIIVVAAFIFPSSSLADRARGGDVNFDVQPRAPSNPSQQVNFTVRATLYKTELTNNCGSRDIRWAVIEKTPDNVKLFFQQGVIRPAEITTATFTKDLSFSKQIQASRFTNLIFYAELWCDKTLGPFQITKSSEIPVNISYSSQGAGQNPTIYACLAADGKYACSPGNKSDLSDVPTCSGRTVLQIARNLCGTSGTATGGGCGTAGQPACQPGASQSYTFEITNPLKGGANTFTDLVKVLVQWIFNLAIPIAVGMIVYAGILFLISQGDTGKVTQARQTLQYAVIGLAIIFIGSGFITLIKSILELGDNQTQEQGGDFGGDSDTDSGSGTISGAVGNKCSRDSQCFEGLKCKSSICQRETGNLSGEACVSGSSCDAGFVCDKSDAGIQVIDGQDLGSCIESSDTRGRIGDACARDNECVSGLKCNKICQRRDGNRIGEACTTTAVSTGNCKSRACSTIGSATTGTCVPYNGN